LAVIGGASALISWLAGGGVFWLLGLLAFLMALGSL